jgi:hypothetical protein
VTAINEVNKLIDFSRERSKNNKNNIVILIGILDEDEMGLVKTGLFSLASSAP